MRTQQIFVSSKNRDVGTPNDLILTFPNGLIKELSTSSVPPKTSIELAEFSINRNWYDVQTGYNDSFKLKRASDNVTFTITIPQGFYTVGQPVPGTGVGIALEATLTTLLNNVVGPSGAWAVTVNDGLGVFAFTLPGTTGGYTLDFTSNNKSNDLLGFPQGLTVCTTTSLLAPIPFNLCRTALLVMHTDLQPAFPQSTIDNFGSIKQPFNNSDIMAVIPVNTQNRGLINYQATGGKINRIWIKAEELRTLRVFITDDQENSLNLSGCEWSAVFRVVYGDNLSI